MNTYNDRKINPSPSPVIRQILNFKRPSKEKKEKKRKMCVFQFKFRILVSSINSRIENQELYQETAERSHLPRGIGGGGGGGYLQG